MRDGDRVRLAYRQVVAGIRQRADVQSASLRRADHLARARLARLVWQAYAGADPRAIAAVLSAPDPGLFPHLDAALRRHLERFPATADGLCALERHALRAIARGHGDFAAMFIVVKDQ
ncbi:MAG: hypothetical protein ACOCYP_11275 [Planctomycetota bacterium]